MTRRTLAVVGMWVGSLPALAVAAWVSARTGGWVLMPAGMVAVVAAVLFLAFREERETRAASNVQASMSARYEIPRAAWFGREALFVVPDGNGGWMQWTPPPAPESQPVEAAKDEEDAA